MSTEEIQKLKGQLNWALSLCEYGPPGGKLEKITVSKSESGHSFVNIFTDAKKGTLVTIAVGL